MPKLVWFYFDGSAVFVYSVPDAAKYGALADQFGLTEAMVNYSTRLKITIDKVWTTPLSPGEA